MGRKVDGIGASTRINHSAAKHCAVDTCFEDDDVAHISPFKRDCAHICSEALRTGNDAGLVKL
jgi:hypothetical protein